MSNQSQSNRAKPIDDGVVGGKRKKKVRPVVVESRWIGGAFKEFPEWGKWSNYGKYRNLEIAKKVVELQLRKFSYLEYRIKQ